MRRRYKRKRGRRKNKRQGRREKRVKKEVEVARGERGQGDCGGKRRRR